MVYTNYLLEQGSSIYNITSRHRNPILHYWQWFKLLYKKRNTYRAIVLNSNGLTLCLSSCDRKADSISKREKIHNLLLKTMFSRKWPIQRSLYFSEQNAEHLKKYCDEIQPDYIFTDMIRTSMYYDSFKHTQALEVLDMDDLLSARYERQLHAQYKSNISGQYAGKLPGFIIKLINNQIVRNAILKLERNLTVKAEIHYSKLYDRVIFVSAVETTYLNKKLPGKAITIPVGINAVPEMELVGEPEKNLLSYVGNLKVAANVDTLHWIISADCIIKLNT